MISFRDLLGVNKTTKRRNSTTDIADVVINTTNKDKVFVTVSQSFFDKADLQNNKVTCHYKEEDSAVYFVVHNDESFPVHFFKGKNLLVRDSDGNALLSDTGEQITKVGVKTNTFNDKKLSQNMTLTEMLSKITEFDVSGITEFNMVKQLNSEIEESNDNFNYSSVWVFVNKASVKEALIENLETFDMEETAEEVAYSNPAQYLTVDEYVRDLEENGYSN